MRQEKKILVKKTRYDVEISTRNINRVVVESSAGPAEIPTTHTGSN